MRFSSAHVLSASQLVDLDRRCLARIAEAALTAKAGQELLSFVSIKADAANQTAFALPMLTPSTHETDRYVGSLSPCELCLS